MCPTAERSSNESQRLSLKNFHGNSHNLILSIDQGTTGTTVALVNEKGVLVDKAHREYRQIYPKPGWVEHNPEEIWQSVLLCIGDVLQRAQVSPNQLAAIGITNQRETVVAWDRLTGEVYGNAIVWQCRRTAQDCERLKAAGLERIIRRKTGLVLDPYFSATKMGWILKKVAGARVRARRGTLVFGTIDTFLLWRLSGGAVFKTDVSNASRTMLMNLKTGDWDEDLLKIFSLPRHCLAEVVPSSGDLGRTVALPGLAAGIPLASVAGDQQAALFGQVAFTVGEAKCTFGTGSFLLMNTGADPIVSRSGCLTTVAWQLAKDKKPTYALEGGAFVCGAAVQWLRDGLQFFNRSDEIEEMARSVTSPEGVEFVPALTGLGAPHWAPHARGLICGLTRGSRRAHIARATLEGMALQNADILAAMQRDLGRKLKSVKVDGGASANNLLMQLQADYLGVVISRPKMIETTVMGAAYLAGLGVGLWPDTAELKKVWQEDRKFVPEMKSSERKKRQTAWHEAVRRTL